jgi:hypothetical protein
VNSRNCSCAAKSGPPGTEHDERCWSRTPENLDPALYWRVRALTDTDCRAVLVGLACTGPGFEADRAALTQVLDSNDRVNAAVAEIQKSREKGNSRR